MSDKPTTTSISKEDCKRLDDLYEMIKRETRHLAGYPCSADFDYSPLYRFLEYPINNVGDPYLASN